MPPPPLSPQALAAGVAAWGVLLEGFVSEGGGGGSQDRSSVVHRPLAPTALRRPSAGCLGPCARVPQGPHFVTRGGGGRCFGKGEGRLGRDVRWSAAEGARCGL